MAADQPCCRMSIRPRTTRMPSRFSSSIWRWREGELGGKRDAPGSGNDTVPWQLAARRQFTQELADEPRPAGQTGTRRHAAVSRDTAAWNPRDDGENRRCRSLVATGHGPSCHGASMNHAVRSARMSRYAHVSFGSFWSRRRGAPRCRLESFRLEGEQRQQRAAGVSRSTAAARSRTWSASRPTAACTRAKCCRAIRCIRNDPALRGMRDAAHGSCCGGHRRHRIRASRHDGRHERAARARRAPPRCCVTSAGMRDALRDRLPGTSRHFCARDPQAAAALPARRRVVRTNRRRRCRAAAARRPTQVLRALHAARAAGINAVAIAFLHGFRHPAARAARGGLRARVRLRRSRRIARGRTAARDSSRAARRRSSTRTFRPCCCSYTREFLAVARSRNSARHARCVHAEQWRARRRQRACVA